MSSSNVVNCSLLAIVMVSTMTLRVRAQTSQGPTPATQSSAATQPSDDLITLTFPENLELKVLVEYVGGRLGINFVYDEQALAQKVTIKTASPVPKESLLGILESALRIKGLVLVDAEQPGWKRIVPVANLLIAAGPATRSVPAAQETSAILGASTRPSAMTEVFALSHADVVKADQAVKPFLTQPGGTSIPLAEQHLLIVTDYTSVVQRVADLLRVIDQPQAQSEVRMITLANVDAQQVATQLTQLLAAKSKQEGAVEPVDIVVDSRTNRLAIVGPAQRLAVAEDLIRQLDAPVGLITHFYLLHTASPDHLDRLARELVRPLDLSKSYQAVQDKDLNALVVTGTEPMQKLVAGLAAQLDVPQTQQPSPVRFYKLTNTTAADVLATIQAVEGSGSSDVSGLKVEGGTSTAPTAGTPPPPGISNTPLLSGQPSVAPIMTPGTGLTSPLAGGTSPSMTGSSGTSLNIGSPQVLAVPSASQQTPGGSTARQTVHGTNGATITSDPNTNTIIVVAPPSAQRVYEELITALDKRRPQVIIEVTLVTLDTSNNYQLGVEFSARGKGKVRALTFSSFGLSSVDASTGALSPIPAPGLNAALLASDVADVVLTAVENDSHAKVLSAPRVLVNDNATGTLASVAESPYNSINASNTVSTTSFAGYASAGTTITVTPHISQGEHLQLEYAVALNNFTGEASGGLPPPRQTDSVQSIVTIPDGSTVVVGGLNSSNYSQTKQAVPLLGQIPILEYLFSNRSETRSESTLFVFIRPVILRDDQFADLKFYSQRDVKVAGIPGDWPSSEPMTLR